MDAATDMIYRFNIIAADALVLKAYKAAAGTILIHSLTFPTLALQLIFFSSTFFLLMDGIILSMFIRDEARL